jgi:formamidopyrimidine-DNA glycosylase
VVEVQTFGKVIVIVTRDDKQMTSLVSTLGMNGWWYPPIDQLTDVMKTRKVYYNGNSVDAVDVIEKALKQSRFEIVCEDGTKLRYVDQRNFGNFTIMGQTDAMKKLLSLGADLLLFENDPLGMNHSFFRPREKLAKRPIGEVLLDQSVLSGIGNIYRAEILYLSRISPERLVRDITDAELDNLLLNTKEVLKNAYHTQSSMSYPIEFVSNNIPDDRFSQVSTRFIPGHLVYGRSKDIFGNAVKQAKVGGRTAWFVPEIQK